MARMYLCIIQTNLKFYRMKKNIFIDKIMMETQTVFHADGNINILPCAFELGKCITANGDTVTRKGRMTVDTEGRSQFRPFRTDGKPRYQHVFNTPHGEVRTTKRSIIVQFVFPKRYEKGLVNSLFGEECDDVKAFLRTRPAGTAWEA